MVAAGNDGLNTDVPAFMSYPNNYAATIPGVISVAASTPSDSLTYFSNYGK